MEARGQPPVLFLRSCSLFIFITFYNKIKDEIKELKEYTELVELENDKNSIEEIVQNTYKIQKELEKFIKENTDRKIKRRLINNSVNGGQKILIKSEHIRQGTGQKKQ